MDLVVAVRPALVPLLSVRRVAVRVGVRVIVVLVPAVRPALVPFLPMSMGMRVTVLVLMPVLMLVVMVVTAPRPALVPRLSVRRVALLQQLPVHPGLDSLEVKPTHAQNPAEVHLGHAGLAHLRRPVDLADPAGAPMTL